MAARATLDNCGTCRYWDTRDSALTPDDRREGRGVCRIMTFPDDFANDFAFDDGRGLVITHEQFFCNLYKVGP